MVSDLVDKKSVLDPKINLDLNVHFKHNVFSTKNDFIWCVEATQIKSRKNLRP